jgi:hypothetical protein
VAARNIFISIFLWSFIGLFTYCSGFRVDPNNGGNDEPIEIIDTKPPPINGGDTILPPPNGGDTIQPPDDLSPNSPEYHLEKTIRERLIETFRSQIGVRQVGDNTGPEIDLYLAAVGLGPGYPWCGAFVGWGYKEHNLTIPNGAAYTPNWFPNRMTIPNKEALTGDVGGIYFSSLGRIAHIVVFEEDFDNGKNLIQSIEGNTNDTGSRTGDGVYRKYRSKNQIYRSANWIDV